MFGNNKKEETVEVNLTDCIGPAFYDMHWDILQNKHTYYNLLGGRGSLKSSVIGFEIVLGIMADPEANAVCYRKVGDTLSTSVYAQIQWCIEKLKIADKWKFTSNPKRITYLPTGQVILFKGLDKAAKSKSIKVPFGYIKYLWFEELDEYLGEEEIRKTQQSVVRGGNKFFVFKSMNPPKSRTNWANSYVETEKTKPDTYTSHTTYLQAPRRWLGKQFIDDAEWMKEVNPEGYKHEYLGEVIGTGTNVFDNIRLEEITDNEIKWFDHIHMGIDWGWYPDPFHWGKMHFDSHKQILYIFDEYRTWKTSNRDTWKYLREKKGVNLHDRIICDSAEHKSTADYRSYGADARDAQKGPDSVRYGIKWLQSLAAIVIDPKRCPETAKEFNEYEYELTPDGQATSNVPDKNNHSIDMVRYAMEPVWKRKGL